MPKVKSSRASKKGSNKVKGRVSAYAFFVKSMREELSRNKESLNFAEFSRACSAKWSGMSDEDKLPFVSLAEQDKIRYEHARLDQSLNQEDEDSQDSIGEKKRKRPRDPNAPKRPLSAFFWFCNDERPKAKERNPGVNIGAITKDLAKMWQAIDPERKKVYEMMAAKDKERYLREKDECDKKLARQKSPVLESTSEAEDEVQAGDGPAPVVHIMIQR